MATTAKEARGKICLLFVVIPDESLPESCCPEKCSVWSWDSGAEAGGEPIGHCVLAEVS